VSGIASGHHVLGVEHLLGELRNSEGSVLLGASGGKWREARHEEVKSGEGNHVDGKLSEIGVELTRESKAGGDTGHGDGDEVVQVTVGGGGELEGSEADVVKGFVIDAVGLIGVLDELVHGEGGVVGLDNGVGDLGGGNDREGVHHSVGVLFSDLGDEEGSHTGAGSTTERMGKLESLEAIAGFGFLSSDVEDGVDELSSFCVVTFSPVVTGAGLSKDEVVGAEDLAERTGSDGVHGSGLEINENSSGHVLAAGGFIVVDVDALELEIGIALV